MNQAFAFCSIILASTICWLLCTLYLWGITKYFTNKISSVASVLEACHLRKMFALFVKFETILYGIITFVTTICIFEFITDDLLGMEGQPCTPDKYFSSPVFWIIWIITITYYIVLMMTNTSCTPYLRMSCTTVDKVKGDYMLFLRGFGTDNYLPSAFIQKKVRNLFSEHKLCERCSFFFETLAVGRPEELNAPSGAKRVYIENVSWKSDVKYLMDNAKAIVILVNDKTNCVWEIVNAEPYTNKTLYIINNDVKFHNALNNESTQNIGLQELRNLNGRFFAYYANGHLCNHTFENTSIGYWKIVNVIRAIMNA